MPAWMEDAPLPALVEPAPEGAPEVMPAGRQTIRRPWGDVLALVAMLPAGAGLIRVSGGSWKGGAHKDKRPRTPGKTPITKAWQYNPETLPAIEEHYSRKAGNVGLLGGVARVVIVDADGKTPTTTRAAVLAALPALADTVEIYRPDAPERAKWLVQVAAGDPLPANTKWDGLEVITQGAQAVIAGDHQTGAPILWRGGQLATVNFDDLAHLARVTVGGQLATEGAQPSRHSPAQATAAANLSTGQAAIGRLLQRLGIEHLGWKTDAGGVKAELESCPVAERHEAGGRPHSHPGKAAVGIDAAGRHWFACQSPRCRHAIAQLAPRDDAGIVSGWRLLRKWAGDDDGDGIAKRQAAKAAVQLQAAAVARVILSQDFAELVPIRLQGDTGYRTGATDKDTAVAILANARRLSLTDFPINQRLIGDATGRAHTTVSRTLPRLRGWLLIPAGMPGRWAIHPDWLRAAAELIEDARAKVAGTHHFTPPYDKTLVHAGNFLEAAQADALLAAALYDFDSEPLTRQSAQPAFVARVDPLTEADILKRCAQADAWRAARGGGPGTLTDALRAAAIQRFEVHARAAIAPAGAGLPLPSNQQVMAKWEVTAGGVPAAMAAWDRAKRAAADAHRALQAAREAAAPVAQVLPLEHAYKAAQGEERRLRPVLPYTRGERLERRLEATQSSLGKGPLVVIQALTDAGGTATRQALIGWLHCKAPALSKHVKALKIVQAVTCPDSHTVTLCGDWLERIQAAQPMMPTALEPYQVRQRHAQEQIAHTYELERTWGQEETAGTPIEERRGLSPETAEKRRAAAEKRRAQAIEEIAAMRVHMPAGGMNRRDDVRLAADLCRRLEGQSADVQTQARAAHAKAKERLEWLCTHTRAPEPPPEERRRVNLPSLAAEERRRVADEAAAITDWAEVDGRLLVEAGGVWAYRPASPALLHALAYGE